MALTPQQQHDLDLQNAMNSTNISPVDYEASLGKYQQLQQTPEWQAQQIADNTRWAGVGVGGSTPNQVAQQNPGTPIAAGNTMIQAQQPTQSPFPNWMPPQYGNSPFSMGYGFAGMNPYQQIFGGMGNYSYPNFSSMYGSIFGGNQTPFYSTPNFHSPSSLPIQSVSQQTTPTYGMGTLGYGMQQNPIQYGNQMGSAGLFGSSNNQMWPTSAA